MSAPFVAEIRVLPYTFPPTGWAWCNGQLLPISQNTALFALLGTFYGGDGKSTFALPGLQGSAPVHQGQGPGLSEYFIGQQGGSGTVTLLESEMPAHTHSLNANGAPADLQLADSDRAMARSNGGNAYKAGAGPSAQLAFQAVPPAGGDLPHNNLMPFVTLNFNIALQGVFPPRG